MKIVQIKIERLEREREEGGKRRNYECEEQKSSNLRCENSESEVERKR